MGVGGAQLGPRRHVSLAWIINAPAFSTRGNCVAAKANGSCSHRAHLSLNLNHLTGSPYDVRADLVTREPRAFSWSEITPSDNWPIFHRNDRSANRRSRAIINSASLKPAARVVSNTFNTARLISQPECDNGRSKREHIRSDECTVNLYVAVKRIS